jgi:hypothetical protein
VSSKSSLTYVNASFLISHLAGTGTALLPLLHRIALSLAIGLQETVLGIQVEK